MTLDTLVRTPTPNQGDNAPRKDVCLICTKVVYPMDKVAADDKIFHKTCLRCGHCKKVLSLGNYAALNNVFYCKPHFKQLFALKGNYSDGFKASEAAAGVTDEKSSPTASPSAIRAKSSPSPAPASTTETASDSASWVKQNASSQPKEDMPVGASLAERMNALNMYKDKDDSSPKKEAPVSEREAPRGTVADRMGMFSKSVENVSASTPERSATPVSATASAATPSVRQNENKSDEVERLTAELAEMREKYAAAQAEIASLKSQLVQREQQQEQAS